MSEIRIDLRFEDRCPECHSFMFLKTRMQADYEIDQPHPGILEWLKVCSGCHAEFVVLVEVMP
jgi:uncharacterized protein with PIN domain